MSDGSILVGFRRSPASTPAHFFPEVEGCLTQSRDGGRSWSEPRVIDFGGVHNLNLTRLAGGTLVYATSLAQPITRGAYERAKDLPQNKDKQGRRALVFTPEDRAKGLIERFGTEFYAMELGVWVRRSTDGGKTWSKPERHRLWGYPYTTVRMPSGRVLLAYGYRKEPYGIRARLIDAECARIDEAEELVLRDDGGRSDLGYPEGALLRDGTALVAYYFNHKSDGGNQRYVAATVVAEK